METLPGSRLQRFIMLLRVAVAALFRRQPASTSWHAPEDWLRPPIPREPAPRLADLQRVIPIVQSQTHQDLTITLISLECYAEGFLLHARYSPKYGDPGPGNVSFTLPILAAHDDVGTSYRWWPQGGDRSRFSCVFAPALHADARELRLDVTEVLWTFPEQRRQVRDTGPWSFTAVIPGMS